MKLTFVILGTIGYTIYIPMKTYYSIIVPVMNESESLPELYQKLTSTFLSLKKDYEVIFIDDGSTDNSLLVLKNFEKKDTSVRIYSFRRNFGKSYALRTGFQQARGEYVITVDADLQDDPTSIKPLLTTLRKEELDMVTGWRKNRQDSGIKKIFSKVFNGLISYLFKLKIHDLNCGLKVYKREVTQDLRLYGGMHRFIPLLASEMGYKVGEKEVINNKRKYGVSKYKATKVFTDLPDLFTIYFITKYTNRPLHFFGKIGSFILLIGGIILVYLSILRLLGERIGGRPLLTFGILFVIAGIQIIVTGLLADLIVQSNSKDEDSIPLKYASGK